MHVAVSTGFARCQTLLETTQLVECCAVPLQQIAGTRSYPAKRTSHHSLHLSAEMALNDSRYLPEKVALEYGFHCLHNDLDGGQIAVEKAVCWADTQLDAQVAEAEAKN